MLTQTQSSKIVSTFFQTPFYKNLAQQHIFLNGTIHTSFLYSLLFFSIALHFFFKMQANNKTTDLDLNNNKQTANW